LLKELYNFQFNKNQYEEPQTYPRTTIVIAALNEEQAIGLTIAELNDELASPHILVVDGHSRDRTVELAKNLGADVAVQDGLGKGDAISKALQLTSNNSDYIVLTDGDFTYPAEYIQGMVKILEENPEVGMVCGNRLNGEVDSEALYSRFFLGNKLLQLAHKIINGIPLEDPLTGLRVIRTEILKNWNVKSQGFDIEVEMNSLVKKKGYKSVEVPIQYRQRIGEKKLKMRHGIVILARIISEALS